MSLDDYAGGNSVTESSPPLTSQQPSACFALAQQQVNQRWATYEEMSARGPDRFPGGIDRGARAARAQDDGSSR